MKKMAVWALVLAFWGGDIQAQVNTSEFVNEAGNNASPTDVLGVARNASGGENEFQVIQNAKGGNPLGDPIAVDDDFGESEKPVVKDVSAGAMKSEQKKAEEPKNEIAPIFQTTPQGVEKPWQEPLPQPSNQIENELYQSGNDIIDVQAYPIKDVSTVTEPNIQPTIINQ